MPAPPNVVGFGTQVVSVTAGSTLAPPWPAGYTAVAGDVCVLVAVARHNFAGSFAPPKPTGYSDPVTVWADVGATTNDLETTVYHKRLTAAEAAPTLAVDTVHSARGISARLVVVRGVDAAQTLDVAAVTSAVSSSLAFTPTGLTTVTADSLLLSIVGFANDAVAMQAGSEQGFGSVLSDSTTSGSDHAAAVASRAVASAGAVTAPTWATTGTSPSAWAAVTLALRSADPTPSDTTPPTITGPSGATGSTSSISVPENTTAVFTFTANESVTWSLNGGADVARFSISGGALSFLVAPDFEAPTDADTNNTYVVGVRATDGAGNATTQTCTVTVTDAAEGTAPVVTTHPSNQSVVAGSTATFTAAASGSPTPTVQWQRNNVDISGATSTSYTTPATTVTGGSANNGDTYRAVFTNASGSATSNSATLTVSAAATAPSITTQPSNQTVTEGATATFSVTATGTAPLSYQWRKNGTNISGATSSSYTTPATVLADSGALYSVVVSNTAGSVPSSNATLTVNAAGGLAGFDFHTSAGCVFGAISGSLTGLAREVGVSITPYVYSASTGALVATLATTATNSAGRLPRLTHASLAAGTTYRVTFVWPDGAAYTISMAAS